MKNQRQTQFLVVGLLTIGLPGCAAFFPELPVVDSVNLQQYAGKWYEIARYPNFFEQNCVGVTAEYTLLDDGQVEVVNTCRKDSLDGELDVITGTARVADPESNAKLRVRFFGPFEGDYWIIELDDQYQYAVVGEPSRSFLWILSRTPQLDQTIIDGIFERLPELGYDPDRLEFTPQETSDS